MDSLSLEVLKYIRMSQKFIMVIILTVKKFKYFRRYVNIFTSLEHTIESLLSELSSPTDWW